MDEERADRLLSRLQYLAKRNLKDFETDPSLLAAFERNLRLERHDYRLDPDVCGEPDCWHTYRELLARDGAADKIRLDCEDAACALSAALFLAGAPALVGVKLGSGRVSHAVCGIGRTGSDGEMKRGSAVLLCDPAVWAGMVPLPEREYERTRWRAVER
jgi:hypothetical protein